MPEVTVKMAPDDGTRHVTDEHERNMETILYVMRCVAALALPFAIGGALGSVPVLVPTAIVAFAVCLVGPVRPSDETLLSRAVAGLLTAGAFLGGLALGATPFVALPIFGVVVLLVSLFPAVDSARERSWFFASFVMLAGLALHTTWTADAPVTISVLAGVVLALALTLLVAPRGRGRGRPIFLRTAMLRDPESRALLVRRAASIAFIACVCLTLSFAIGDLHVGWITVAAVATLQPDPRGLVTRFTDRIVGTVCGALVAWGALRLLGPTWMLVVLAIAVAGASAYTRLRNYAVYVGFITAFILMLSGFITNQQGWLVIDRVVDTLIGALLAMGLFVVMFPRPSRDRFEVMLEAVREQEEGTALGV